MRDAETQQLFYLLNRRKLVIRGMLLEMPSAIELNLVTALQNHVIGGHYDPHRIAVFSTAIRLPFKEQPLCSLKVFHDFEEAHRKHIWEWDSKGWKPNCLDKAPEFLLLKGKCGEKEKFSGHPVLLQALSYTLGIIQFRLPNCPEETEAAEVLSTRISGFLLQANQKNEDAIGITPFK